MRIGAFIGNILKAALVVGAVYAFMQWKVDEPRDDDVRSFAERDCVNEIRNRFDTSTVSVYAIKESNDGYVVRATVTLAKGTTAKVYCLTSSHGGVKEIMVEER